MMLRTALASLALCLSVDAFTVNVAPAGRAALARPCHAMRRGMQLPATRMSAGEPVLAPKPVLATGDSAAKTPGYGPHIKIGKSEKILNPWGLWVLTYSMVLAFAGYFYLKFRQILSTVLFGLVKGPSPEHCCWIMHKSSPAQSSLPARWPLLCQSSPPVIKQPGPRLLTLMAAIRRWCNLVLRIGMSAPQVHAPPHPSTSWMERDARRGCDA